VIREAFRQLTAWTTAHPIASFIVFFAVFPFLVPYQSLATQVLIFGLFALGFNLLYGYTGLLSFGHAAYYGLGAYGTGIALAKLKLTSLWVALGLGFGAAMVGGALVGFFCLRRRGIYFAMLTLAFAQMLYFIAFHAADLTGGDDGLRGITVRSIVDDHRRVFRRQRGRDSPAERTRSARDYGDPAFKPAHASPPLPRGVTASHPAWRGLPRASPARPAQSSG